MLIPIDNISGIRVIATLDKETGKYRIGDDLFDDHNPPNAVEQINSVWKLDSQEIIEGDLYLNYMYDHEIVSGQADEPARQASDVHPSTLDPLQRLEQLMIGKNPGSFKWNIIIEFSAKRGHELGHIDSELYIDVIPDESLAKKYHMKTFQKKIEFHSSTSIDVLIVLAAEYIQACNEVIRTMDCVKKYSD